MLRFVAVLLLMAGCSTPGNAPESPVEPSQSSTPPTIQEQYLQAVESDLGPINRDQTLVAGYQTCDALDVMSPRAFMSGLADIDDDVVVSVVSNAVKYLCPEHRSDFVE